ncbi:MAG: oligosaccharide flippase family protein [Sphingomonadaceae bacterium]|nr:oligosaccharide flippase family protein [Sphingomonadaceae bacterium]
MTGPTPAAAADAEESTAELARGGRTSFAGFVLRLLARMPFLFIAGRLYGSAELGRFGYAILVVELTAQLATIGLRRGMADALAREAAQPATGAPPANTVADALFLSLVLAAVGAALLIAVPTLVFPNGVASPVDRLFPLVAIAPALIEISLAALAFRHDIVAQVRARAIVEPWTLSLAAWPALHLVGARQGLLVSYALSMAASAATALWPCWRSYGRPRRWRPHTGRMWRMAADNIPRAGADLADWGSRRLDFFILGRFASPEVTGIYFVAQNMASMAAKLKNSFDSIIAPLLATAIAEGDRAQVAAHVRQVAFWVLTAQFAVVLSLGSTSRASLGLFGPTFPSGAAVFVLLLLVELFSSQGAVCEDALVYLKPRTNLAIAFAGVVLQAVLTLVFVPAYGPYAAAGGLAAAVFVVSLVKSAVLRRVVGAGVSGWRPALIPAALGGFAVGVAVLHSPEVVAPALHAAGLGPNRSRAVAEALVLTVGQVAILSSFGTLIWTIGFTPADKVLFQLRKARRT